jgi:hypothetical protein
MLAATVTTNWSMMGTYMNGFLLSSYSHQHPATFLQSSRPSKIKDWSFYLKQISLSLSLSLSLSHTHTHTHTQNLLLQLSSEEIEGIFLIYVSFSGYNYCVYIALYICMLMLKYNGVKYVTKQIKGSSVPWRPIGEV